jgi:hypothetical protein
VDAFEEPDAFVDLLELLLVSLAIYPSRASSRVPSDLIDLLLQLSLGHDAWCVVALNARIPSGCGLGCGAAVGEDWVSCVVVKDCAPVVSEGGGVMYLEGAVVDVCWISCPASPPSSRVKLGFQMRTLAIAVPKSWRNSLTRPDRPTSVRERRPQ